MLPRPVVLSLPGRLGYQMMRNNIWLKELCQDISQLCLNHLQHNNNEDSRHIIILLEVAKQKIPTSLRICNTLFTQMVIVGWLDDYRVNGNHIDQEDLISCILTIGDNNIQGEKHSTLMIMDHYRKKLHFNMEIYKLDIMTKYYMEKQNGKMEEESLSISMWRNFLKLFHGWEHYSLSCLWICRVSKKRLWFCNKRIYLNMMTEITSTWSFLAISSKWWE